MKIFLVTLFAAIALLAVTEQAAVDNALVTEADSFVERIKKDIEDFRGRMNALLAEVKLTADEKAATFTGLLAPLGLELVDSVASLLVFMSDQYLVVIDAVLDLVNAVVTPVINVSSELFGLLDAVLAQFGLGKHADHVSAHLTVIKDKVIAVYWKCEVTANKALNGYAAKFEKYCSEIINSISNYRLDNLLVTVLKILKSGAELAVASVILTIQLVMTKTTLTADLIEILSDGIGYLKECLAHADTITSS